MKKKTTLLLFILLNLPHFLFSQYAVSGTLSDGEQVIEFANVVLYNADDHQLIKAVTSDINGTYHIATEQKGEFYIKALMLGFEEFESEHFLLNDTQTTLKLDIVLVADAETLEEVEVVAKVPLVEQKADRMVVNVSKSLTNVSGSLMEIMKKVPGMIVANGKLSVAGGGSPTILIDGKTTQYMDIQSLLREMPGDNIERIEVIHQPGAEFEASGNGPILNIILKKNKMYGTNGSVKIGIGKADRWRYNTGLRLNVRQGKFNITGGIGYSHNTSEEGLIVDRYQNGDRFYSVNETPYNPHTYRGNVGVDYYLNKKHTFGLGFRATKSDNDRTNTNQTDIYYADGEPDATLITNNHVVRNWNYIRPNAYYTFDIDTLGQKLEWDIDYAKFNREANNIVRTQIKAGQANEFTDVRNLEPGATEIFSTKLDYTKPINEQISLQFGGKYSHADLDNDLISENKIGEEWINNLGLSNHYLFDEKIYAAYGKSSFNFDKWSGTFGLRYEHSISEGYSVTVDSSNQRILKKLFPSASISRNITSNLALSLAYSYRIERPSFFSLNPFVRYMDPFTLEKGNPLLRPELTHNTKLSLSFEKQPFFNLEYSRTQDIITLVTQQDPTTNITEAFDDNLNSYERIGGSLFFPLDLIPKISGYGGFMLYNNKFSDKTRADSRYNSSKWSFTSFVQANFTVPGDIKAELSGWFTSGGQDGIIQYENMYGISAGFQKSFLHDKLDVSLSFDDILNKFFRGTIDYDNFRADVESTWNNKIVSLRATYKFGNQFLKKKKNRNNTSSEEINRASEKN